MTSMMPDVIVTPGEVGAVGALVMDPDGDFITAAMS